MFTIFIFIIYVQKLFYYATYKTLVLLLDIKYTYLLQGLNIYGREKHDRKNSHSNRNGNRTHSSI